MQYGPMQQLARDNTFVDNFPPVWSFSIPFDHYFFSPSLLSFFIHCAEYRCISFSLSFSFLSVFLLQGKINYK